MKSGNRTLNWNTPMFPHSRAHFDPKVGDARNAILRTAKQPLGADGIRAMDANVQVVTAWVKHPVTGKRYLRKVAYLMHWTKPVPNGFTRVVDKKTGRIRAMTRLERTKPLSWWGPEGVDRWRRPNGERPLRYSEAVALAAKHGVVIVAELKSRLFVNADFMRSMVDAARRANHPAWFMALNQMWNVRGKALATAHAGGQFLVIFGKWRRTQARRTPSGVRWWTTPGVHVERSTWTGARR